MKLCLPILMMQLEGQPCDSLGLMLSGVKRIYKASGSGREITLYEVGPGETSGESSDGHLVAGHENY